MAHLIAGNWKMNCGAGDGIELARGLRTAVPAEPTAEILVCPPFTALPGVIAALAGSRIAVGAQDCYWKEAGAFTGEISPGMLRNLGCSHVILGHSERRQYCGEDDETVARKVKAALAGGLIPILCVGERAGEDGFEVVGRQVRAAFAEGCVIAYEPVWAIGSGRPATPADAAAIAALIRRVTRPDVQVLYGGSVNASNCAGFWTEGGCDGALVGGASLDAAAFAAIVSAACR